MRNSLRRFFADVPTCLIVRNWALVLFFMTGCLAAATSTQAAAIVISGYIANPSGTDSPFEYVQLKATQDIDFSATPYSVVWANNGTATASGWVNGVAITYGFDLSSGTVAAGGVVYVGGSGKLIDGSSSTDISGESWIRAIATNTTGGDGGLGNANSAGVMGNGGTANGIAVFQGGIASLTATTTPVDALFYGGTVNTAKPATGGYAMPDNDHYRRPPCLETPLLPTTPFFFRTL